jgi:hypothetical protein
MSIHLNKFVDRLRGFEARGVKDFTMSMSDAKDLHADITRLLLNLQTLQTAVTNNVSEDQSIRVEIKGGTFK